MEIDQNDEVQTLLKKAAEAPDSGDAMRFSQAALNAANAVAVMVHTGIAVEDSRLVDESEDGATH